MTSSSYPLIIAYTIAFGAYWSWVVTTKILILLSPFFGSSVELKKLIITVFYFLPIITIPRLLPQIFEDYSIMGLILGLGIIPFFSWNNVVKRRNNLGEILFASQYTSPFNYVSLLLIFIALIWILPQAKNRFFSSDIFATTTFGGIEINSYICGACLVIWLLSNVISYILSSWAKLEIRDRGLWMASTATTWEKIIDYSWSEQQPDLLMVKSINGFQKELTNKYQFLSTEKVNVTDILTKKLGPIQIN